MEEIRARMTKIEDQRHPSYVKYLLADILIIVMCAVLCGLDTLEDLVIYAKNKQDFWTKELGIKAIPSKATFARVLSVVDGKEISDAILDILRMRFGTAGGVIAVDGKAICSTAKAGNPHSALQILSAYMTENGVVLAQEAIHEKTNEIPVFQEMLTYLNVEGKTVTADAMHCQRETCRRIIHRKGDYLFGLKENQPSLLEDVRLFFENSDEKGLDRFQTIEKNAGRVEKRICRKIKDISWLKGHKWTGLQSVFSIERIVEARDRHSRETSYYISSCDHSPKQLMVLSREHWKIESMHWLLDVTFSEDDCRFLSENAHRTMNAMRKFAIAVHKNFLAAHQFRWSKLELQRKIATHAHLDNALDFADKVCYTAEKNTSMECVADEKNSIRVPRQHLLKPDGRVHNEGSGGARGAGGPIPNHLRCHQHRGDRCSVYSPARSMASDVPGKPPGNSQRPTMPNTTS